MKCSNRTKLVVSGLLVLFFVSGGAFSEVLEPASNPDYRELRTDYVRDWYIYIDTDNNGILNPGDQKVSMFQNWWSTKSSSTMHNQDITWEPASFPDDKPSSPMNWATDSHGGTAENNYWLTQKEDRMGFYMNYSQWNNCTIDHYSQANYHVTEGGVSDEGTLAAYYREKYGDRNGYAMGWLTNKNDAGSTDNSPRSNVTMDVYVHDGKYQGTVDAFTGPDKWNNSNPQVSQSNDITSDLANDPMSGLRYPGKFDEGTMTYSPAANRAMQAWFDYGYVAKSIIDTLTDADLAAIAAAMEIREVDPFSEGSGLWANIFPDKSAEDIRDSAIIKALLAADSQAVSEYLYQDAMMDRSTYAQNATDGGVISGLGAMGSEPFDINEWTQQQVIRLDLEFDSEERSSLIDEIVFYDFGAAAGSSQINPTEIMFRVDASGNLYFDADNNGTFDALTDVYLPDNRIYIAQVEIVPEPATLVLLAAGMAGIIARKLRKRLVVK